MADSSLKFGTSGLRGLVTDLNEKSVVSWTTAFLKLLHSTGDLDTGSVFIGHDLRASSDEIQGFVAKAINAAGLTTRLCGALPTPALAYFAMKHHSPAIMITGSHIPDDRNGLKFYRSRGEINKADEEEIRSIHHSHGYLSEIAGSTGEYVKSDDPIIPYKQRYLASFGTGLLAGLRVGIYEHSSVGRDVLREILEALGSEVLAFGRSDTFVPIDTEAIGRHTSELIENWIRQQSCDAVVSTDGDADRPLVFDERGHQIPGDLIGAITATVLQADEIVTPVTSNSAIEAQKLFNAVHRTRVGSPHVIEKLGFLASESPSRALGFEANGGIILTQDFSHPFPIVALPTRDAILPIICCLHLAAKRQAPLSKLTREFGFNAKKNQLLRVSDTNAAVAFLSAVSEQPDYAAGLFSPLGAIESAHSTDGIQFKLDRGIIVHFRLSGNAPELRCYVEAGSDSEAETILAWALEMAETEIANF